jgi:Protein of unknown function (DUF3074)
MAQEANLLGPYVRLEGIAIRQLPPDGQGVKPADLPPPPEKASDKAKAVATPDLKTFVTNVIVEGVSFIDGVAPKDGSASTWKVKGSPKKYASSHAPVHLYARTVPASALSKIEGMGKAYERNDETWFCRRSCHENKAERGTASWDEFKHSFKEHHAETEEAFTPTVIGAREAIRWDAGGIELETQGQHWTNISVAVEEMKHKIDPKPLKNRTFPVAQVTAELAGVQEFIVVSIPLTDFQNSPYAEYARDKSLVVARYTSIERIRVLPGSGEVEWIMATASDAGGVLPHWMQNLAVPSAVAKDVEMFLGWIPSQRKGKPSDSKAADTDPAPAPSNGETPTADSQKDDHPPSSVPAGDEPTADGEH